MAERLKASTYGNDPTTGYRDAADNNRPALSGASNNRPGIALYRPKTLGGWYRVTAPNGRTAVVQHTDIGPAPWIGAQLDVNAVAARQFGYRQGNAFPTKQGSWRVEYLGKRKPSEAGVTVSVRKKPAVSQPASSQSQPSANQSLLRAYLQQRGNPGALLSLAASVRR